MKKMTLAIAVMLACAGTAMAAEPAMVMEAGGSKIYTDAKGMTLYTFDKDTAGVTNCYEKCAQNWPPFMAAADAKAEGAWTIVDRKDGTKMWALNGKPLYTYIKDEKKGDVVGEGVGGVWHIAKAM